jgi:cell division protein FtsZ
MMSIGQGEGEHKTRKALEQALHHPLLETVSLENAAGIIANFTGGNDLTLFEVQEALSDLQEQTANQTEIVLGVISDERMEDRVMITLIVTGLGAPTLEETLSKVVTPTRVELSAPPPVDKLEARPQAVTAPAERSEPLPQGISMLSTSNLDLPAFLRRRARLAGLENG